MVIDKWLKRGTLQQDLEARGFVISSLSPRCEMIFLSTFEIGIELLSHLTISVDQNGNEFQPGRSLVRGGFISSQKPSSFGVFWWNAATIDPSSHDCPQYLFYKKSLTLTQWKTTEPMFFFFSKNILGISIFSTYLIWQNPIQRFSPLPTCSPATNHWLWPQLVDLNFFVENCRIGVPGFPEEVPGLGGSREGGEGGEGDEIAGNNNDNDNSLTVLQGHPEFSWIFGTLWSVDGLNCLLWMFHVFFWICFPYILKTGGWIPVSTGGNPAVSSTCRENFLKNLLQTFCPEVGDEDKGKKRRGRTYRILFHQVARRGNPRGWKSNQSLKLKAK